jgi:hypothetical protein
VNALTQTIALFTLMVSTACTAEVGGEEAGTDGTKSELSTTRGCRGKREGDACTLCHPNDRRCVESAAVKTCNPERSGNWTVLRCGAAPVRYEPCAGKQRGELCALCDPRNPGCFETSQVKACDSTGTCSSDNPVLDCRGKARGVRCTQGLDDTDLDVESRGFCDGRGACRASAR